MRRDVGDVVDRRIAEHADRQHAGLRGGRPAAPLRAAVTWRGLPGTNTKPANAAGRAAREVRAAVEAAQFGAAEDQLARGLRRDRRRASATSRQEAVDLRREPVDVGARRNAGLRNEHAVAAPAAPAARSSTRSMMRSRRSRLLMPISGAPSASARRISRFVMDLDQRIHAEARAPRRSSRAPLIVEQRQHHQDRVGAGDPRLGDLARVDEEVLGEDRSVEFAARGGEVVERSAEECGRRRARSAHRRRRHSRAPAPPASASGRIAPADGDAFLISRMKRAPGCASAAREAARASASRGRAARRATRRRSAPASSLALGRRDLAENAAVQPRLASMKSSSTCGRAAGRAARRAPSRRTFAQGRGHAGRHAAARPC